MPSNQRNHKKPPPENGATLGEADAWDAVIALRRRLRAVSGPLAFPLEISVGNGAPLAVTAEGDWQMEHGVPPPDAAAAQLLDLYLPLVLAAARRPYVTAHLGQSLDGRIATIGGASQWLTGAADQCHTHRLRALADAVIVGAATVRQDDPQLTVRHCEGDQPVRVVLDTNLTLAGDRKLFRDGAAPTLILAASDKVACGGHVGDAEIVPVPRQGESLALPPMRDALAARGLTWLFVEGGGVTVSRFLAAGMLDRLQIVVAPVILGSGRPGLQLPEINDLARAIWPRVRRFMLGADMLVECIFHE